MLTNDIVTISTSALNMDRMMHEIEFFKEHVVIIHFVNKARIPMI
jgi:hypothetical protein